MAKRDVLMVFLGAGLGLVSSYVHQSQMDEDHRQQVAIALVYEMAQNQRILKNAIEKAHWRENAINTSLPSMAVTSPALVDPVLFNGDISIDVRHGLVRYAEQVEAVQSTMHLLTERFQQHGRLDSGSLANLDTVIINTLAVLYPVQSKLDAYIQEKGAVLGYKGMVERLEGEFDAKHEELTKSIKRPLGNKEVQ